MAARRMFARSIVRSARFLQMSAEARLLYYALGMEADDDGVAEAFLVLRAEGAGREVLGELEEKGYVTVLNQELVTFIRDWKVNNQLRADRHVPSIYTDLLSQIPDWQPDGNQVTTIWQPSIGKDRIEEDREEKEREEKGRAGEARIEAAAPAPAPCFPPSLEDVRDYCWDEGLKVQPQEFLDYYAARDWKLSRGLPMTDWRAALRTWARRGKEDGYGTSGRHSEPEYERVPSVADGWFD